MQLQAIGFIQTPYEEKFGTPRQPGLVREAWGVIQLVAPWDRPEAVRGLEEFSHLWVICGFHQIPSGQAKPTVRPPRLGGNERIGVFASRSPFRPNPIGLSVVKLEKVSPGVIEVSGVDIVDGSPVYDLKPYLPWAEAFPEAKAGFAAARPEKSTRVLFAVPEPPGELRGLIAATLELDPAPAYREKTAGPCEYGMRLAGHEVRWRLDPQSGTATVFEITPVA